MSYKAALVYLEKHWPKTAAWVEQTVGSRDAANPQANADLAVMAQGEHLSLVQCGLLIWIASSRPLNDPQNNWPGKSPGEIQKMFLSMNDEDLKAYLGSYERTFPAAVVVPSSPALGRPVVPTHPSSQPPPRPPRHDLASGSLPQQTQPAPNPGRPLPQLTTPAPVPLRQGVPTVGVPQPPQPVPSSRRPGAPTNPLPQLTTPPPVPPHSGLPGRLSPQLSQPSAPTRQVNVAPVPTAAAVRPRRLSKGPDLGNGLIRQAELIGCIEKMEDLKTLFICDIPTGVHGAYLTERSTGAVTDNAKINIAKIDNPEGWLRLGRGVLTNRMGKCWSCAAAVIYKLVTDPRFDAVRIESIGAEDYDHHFVVINREAGTDVTNMKTWNGGAILIDAWQANLTDWTNVKPDGAKKAILCYGRTTDFPYESKVRFFCAFEPANRREHREAAGEVGKFVQAQTIDRSWRKLKTCYLEHLLKGIKSPSCEVSGFCGKK